MSAAIKYTDFNPQNVTVSLAGDSTNKFTSQNTTIEWAPTGLAKQFLVGEGLGGVLQARVWVDKDKRVPGAKQPMRDLQFPELYRDGAHYSGMVTPRLSQELADDPQRGPRLRAEQYVAAKVTYACAVAMMRGAFDQRLGDFAPHVMAAENEARAYYFEMKASDWTKSGRTLTDDDFDALVDGDAELASAIKERAFKKFLAAARKMPPNPDLYNWSTTGDVKLKVPGQLCPATNKPYPPVYSIFVEWYVFAGRFDEASGELLPRPDTKKLTVPPYEQLPSTPENYAEINRLCYKDNMVHKFLKFYERGVEMPRPTYKFALAADTQLSKDDEWWRYAHKDLVAAKKPLPEPAEQRYVELPDPWWCGFNARAEDVMVTLTLQLRLMIGKKRNDIWGVGLFPTYNIGLPYRKMRPQSESGAAAAPPSDNSALFLTNAERAQIPSSQANLFDKRSAPPPTANNNVGEPPNKRVPPAAESEPASASSSAPVSN